MYVLLSSGSTFYGELATAGMVLIIIGFLIAVVLCAVKDVSKARNEDRGRLSAVSNAFDKDSKVVNDLNEIYNLIEIMQGENYSGYSELFMDINSALDKKMDNLLAYHKGLENTSDSSVRSKFRDDIREEEDQINSIKVTLEELYYSTVKVSNIDKDDGVEKRIADVVASLEEMLQKD